MLIHLLVRFQNTERDLKMEKQWRTTLQSELEQVNATNVVLAKDSEQLAVLKTEHETLQHRVGDLQEVVTVVVSTSIRIY